MSNLIKPHGSETLNPLFVFDDSERAALAKEAEGLPSVVVSSAAAANAVLNNRCSGSSQLKITISGPERKSNTRLNTKSLALLNLLMLKRRTNTPKALRPILFSWMMSLMYDKICVSAWII